MKSDVVAPALIADYKFNENPELGEHIYFIEEREFTFNFPAELKGDNLLPQVPKITDFIKFRFKCEGMTPWKIVSVRADDEIWIKKDVLQVIIKAVGYKEIANRKKGRLYLRSNLLEKE